MRVSMVAVPAVSPTLQSGGLAMSLQSCRNLSQRLLKLRKEVPFSGAHDCQPFCLSLRKPSEFSDVHSFGFLKVPHIGVYGDEYAICSPVILLSLPVTPRSLRAMPHDVVCALDLNEVAEMEPPKNCCNAIDVSEHASMFLDDQDPITEAAKKLVREVIEEAVKKVNDMCNAKLCGRRESKMDTSEIYLNIPQVHGESGFWTVAHSSIREGSDLDESEGSHDDRDSINQESMHCPPKTNVKDCADNEAELRSLARSLVLKCIQAACNEITARQQLGASVESLISSTKRMRIDSPPPPPHPYSFSDSIFKNPKSFSNSDSGTPTKSRSPMPDRCLTPESLRREKLWKKRGRSESHEVNSLLDYDAERSRYQSAGIRGIGGLDTGVDEDTILEEYNSDGEDAVNLTAIVSDLKKMTLHGRRHFSDGEEEEEDVDSEDGKSDLPTVTDGFKKQVRFGVFSPLLKNQRTSSLRSPPPKSHQSPSPQPLPVSMDSQTSDIGIAMYENSVPEMDFFLMVHTCPPPGVCQKFMCNNWNEVNLLFHCWLFRDFPCDPAVTVSENLSMGVFMPQNVQPVHLDLMDAGVTFHFMEERSVVIHGCRFSPENAQLQLQMKNSSERNAESSSPFYSFFSIARHEDRRVVTYHMLPSTCNLEHALKEIAQKCDTLGELISMLGSSFPEVQQVISNFILTL